MRTNMTLDTRTQGLNKERSQTVEIMVIQNTFIKIIDITNTFASTTINTNVLAIHIRL